PDPVRAGPARARGGTRMVLRAAGLRQRGEPEPVRTAVAGAGAADLDRAAERAGTAGAADVASTRIAAGWRRHARRLRGRARTGNLARSRRHAERRPQSTALPPAAPPPPPPPSR